MSYTRVTPEQLTEIMAAARLAGVPEATISAAVAGDRAALVEMTETLEDYTDRLARAEARYLESLPPLERFGVEVRWTLDRAWSRLRRWWNA